MTVFNVKSEISRLLERLTALYFFLCVRPHRYLLPGTGAVEVESQPI
jgi:hypothetical protein